MRPSLTAASVVRLPRRTLRAQLALLYTAVFGLAFVAVAAVAVIFKPNFLVKTSCNPAPQTTNPPAGCGQHSGLSFAGTMAHDAQQNVAGMVMVAVIAVIALGIGWLIAGRVLRPLRTITATAREISATNLHQRLTVAGPDDEFRQLGDTLDGLFGRLEASFQAQRHFVANASHELRTPLTAEKTVLQVALADPDATTATLGTSSRNASSTRC
jgi:signal transduction histidine kinase